MVLDEAEALLRQRTSQGGGGGGLSTGVAYMLTRFDRYSGVLVATTNRIEDLDEAFFVDLMIMPLFQFLIEIPEVACGKYAQ